MELQLLEKDQIIGNMEEKYKEQQERQEGLKKSEVWTGDPFDKDDIIPLTPPT